MRQTTFSDIEYSNRRRKTKREQFLDAMESIIPWDHWVGLIHPYYPAGKRGRPPKDIEKRIDKDESLSDIECRINRRPSSIKMSASYLGYQWDREIENRKSSVRSKVEHPFLIVKKQFGYCKTAYRGLAKNLNRFYVLFASANLLMCIRADRTADFVWDNYAIFREVIHKTRPKTTKISTKSMCKRWKMVNFSCSRMKK